MRRMFLWSMLLLSFAYLTNAQSTGVLRGVVAPGDGGEYLFHVRLEGLALGVTTETDGAFELREVPAGEQTVVISGVGYRTLFEEVTIRPGEVTNLQVKALPDVLNLDQIVVSASREGVERRSAPVLVSVLDGDAFTATQSVCLAEGLNFQPGLRVETDCQTCNYTQLRINGLGGGYSQILIDSRPLLSALGGLYGLEQIPASMIERVEVVRGGGSALYGSSAVAGTVNIITRDPEESSYAVTLNQALIDGQSADHSLQANLSVVDPETKRSGLSVYAARRNRQEYDANGDGFSELSRLEGLSFGGSGFWKIDPATRLRVALHHLGEVRDGGDRLDLPPHQRTQAENRRSHLLAASFDLETRWRERHQLSFFGGAQQTRRTHYTGLFGADGYGDTDNHTLQGGLQYAYRAEGFWLGPNTIRLGTEYQLDDVLDEIPAYGYRIDQRTRQLGAFLQSDWRLHEKVTLSAGGRITLHNLVDRPIGTPRLALLYQTGPQSRWRFSYARGFRAPQAFDADLHIAFAGGGIATVRIDPELRPEFSDSYTLSFDFDRPSESSIWGFTLNGFFTQLHDAFILEEAGGDGAGNIILEKRNGGGSHVLGLTLEGRANFNNWLEGQAGITWQESLFAQAVAWSAEIPGTRQFLRTPGRYGFTNLTFFSGRPFSGSFSSVYTGPMEVPHFAGAPGVPEDRLLRSADFLELNCKLNYTFRLPGQGQQLTFSAGVQNLTNAYQRDFDTGPERDSNFVYGPARPRTFFVGLKMEKM